MKRTLLMLVAVLLVLPGVAAAQRPTYKWIDSQGNISYHDRPPPAGSEYQVEEQRFKNRQPRASDQTSDTGDKAPVVLYSIPKCDPCDLARAHLQKRNVPFAEKNVEKDVALQKEVRDKAGALSVPVITVGDKVLNTYSQGWLDSELDQAGYAKATPAAPGEKPAEETGFRAPTQ